jgi:hypothetical protein
MCQQVIALAHGLHADTTSYLVRLICCDNGLLHTHAALRLGQA